MAARRVKIEFYDDMGSRHTLSVEGDLTRETISKILDYVELMGGVSPAAPSLGRPGRTKLERLTSLVLSRFSGASFLSGDVEVAFREVYGDPISSSTAATYLSRLSSRGILSRVREGAAWRYSVRRSWSPFVEKQRQPDPNPSLT